MQAQKEQWVLLPAGSTAYPRAKGRRSERWDMPTAEQQGPLILPPSGGGARGLPKCCILVNWIARPTGRELGESVSSETKKEMVDLSGN